MSLQQLINGLTAGYIYVLIALGYTMVYGILESINFAHGEISMRRACRAIIALGSLSQGDVRLGRGPGAGAVVRHDRGGGRDAGGHV